MGQPVISDSLVLQQVRYLNPWTGQDERVTLERQGDKVLGIHPSGPAEAPQASQPDLIFAPGLVDLYSYSGEPGHEDRETLRSLLEAAWAGGWTHLGILPDMQPGLDHPAVLKLLQSRLQSFAPDPMPQVHFWGCLTRDRAGEQLSELGDLLQAGVVGFTDNQGLSNLTLVRRALEYLQPWGTPLGLVPIQPRLRGNGVMREGGAAIRFGLPGEPVMTETSAIAAIVEMMEAFSTPVHLLRVSTARGVELIAQAKARNLPLTASVTWMHLLFQSEALGSYDPNLRLDPPLGNLSDQQALIQGLRAGIIDAIAVDHRAYTYEEKTLAFAEAPPGAIGLELALPCLWQGLVMTEQLTALELWQALTVNPRHCLGFTDPHRHWLLFNPQTPWPVQASTLKTLGQNTPYLGQTLTGQVEAILQWDEGANPLH